MVNFYTAEPAAAADSGYFLPERYERLTRREKVTMVLFCILGTPLIILAAVVYIVTFLFALVVYLLIFIFIRLPTNTVRYLLLKFYYKDEEAAGRVRFNPFNFKDENPFPTIPGVNDLPPKYEDRKRYELVQEEENKIEFEDAFLPRYESLECVTVVQNEPTNNI